MTLVDINVLVGAFIEDDPNHVAFRQWLQNAASKGTRLGLAGVVLSGFIRIVTNPKIYDHPVMPTQAFAFIRSTRDRSRMMSVHPGPRHLQIFEDLCASPGVRGSLVSDAYLASIALEQNAAIATADRDFARFSGVRVINPLDN